MRSPKAVVGLQSWSVSMTQWCARDSNIARKHYALRRLETEQIDLYQIHRPGSDTDVEKTLSIGHLPGISFEHCLRRSIIQRPAGPGGAAIG